MQKSQLYSDTMQDKKERYKLVRRCGIRKATMRYRGKKKVVMRSGRAQVFEVGLVPRSVEAKRRGEVEGDVRGARELPR